jgi:hypothetical protein
MQCVRFGHIYPLSYQNLVQLEFRVNDCNWHVLQDLLQNAPNLEILDVTKVSLVNRGVFIFS